MRRPRLRFTIRSVMIAVAVAGVVLAGVRIRRRQAEYRQQAAFHGALEVTLRTRAEWEGRMAARGYVPRRAEAYSRARADSHARLKASYERAASRPWTSVAPGPE